MERSINLPENLIVSGHPNCPTAKDDDFYKERFVQLGS